MIKLSSEARRLRAGSKNLHNLLMGRGWSCGRKMTDHFFTDTYTRAGEKIIVTGVGAWLDSISDQPLYLETQYQPSDGNFVRSKLALIEDFVFARGKGSWVSDEARRSHLRKFNDFIGFVDSISC